jgi:hypothetical protein
VRPGEAGSGACEKARDAGQATQVATWDASDSGHLGGARSTKPTLTLERDTVHPDEGGDAIAASRGSTNCQAPQGQTDQQWSSGIAATGNAHEDEFPLVPGVWKVAAVKRARALSLGMARSFGCS